MLLPYLLEFKWRVFLAMVLLVGLSLGLGDIAGSTLLSTLQRDEILAWSIGLNIVLSAVIGLMYLSWLASWWVGRQHSQVEA